ncbi:hypothetical protein Tco_0942773 [Tanacetum coccineum]
MKEQSHYKQEKMKTRPKKANLKIQITSSTLREIKFKSRYPPTRMSSGRLMCLIIPFRVFSIWEALGGNTRDLDSIWEETGQDHNFTQSGFKDARTVPGNGVAISIDAVRNYKRWHQKLCDDVRT